MQPASAMANKKKTSIAVKNKAPVVSAAQSKDIMDDLLGELDNQDEDQLQDIRETHDRPVDVADEQMAFNKDEEIELKYAVATAPIARPAQAAADKKRPIADITAAAPKRRNPFQKDQPVEAPAQVDESMVYSSAFQSAVDVTI